MIRKTKLLICLLLAGVLLVGLTPVGSSAEELQEGAGNAETILQDENSQRLEETTTMDEAGNITVIDDGTGETGRIEGIEEINEAGEINEAEMEEEIINYRDAAPADASRAAEIMVVNLNTKGNAVTTYTDESRGTSGYTNGAFGADAAYLGKSGTKVRFMLSGVIGMVEDSEVELVPYSSVTDAVSYYTVSGGSLKHYIAQNMNKKVYSTLSNGPAPSCLSEGRKYYSYDGHYFYSDYKVMQADYVAGTRANALNPSSPYYNYYQYLPLRTATNYSADKLNEILNQRIDNTSKLKNIGETLITYQYTYGVNALLTLSVAVNESGWGMSSICQTKNNLFGLNAVDTSPGTSANTYASVDECVRQFMSNYMSSGYLKPTDWRYYGGFLGNKGSGINVKYASDPYWGEKAANVAWNLDSAGGSLDKQYYAIGIKGTEPEDYTSVNVRKEPTTASAILYQTKSQPDYAVFLHSGNPEKGFYRIQSDAALSGDRTAISGSGEYQFDKMYAYISSDYITVVNQGAHAIPDQSEDIGAPNESETPEIVPIPDGGTITPPSSDTEPGGGTTVPPSSDTEPNEGTTPAPVPDTEPDGGTTPAPDTEPNEGTTPPSVPDTEPDGGATVPPLSDSEADSEATTPTAQNTEPDSGTTTPPAQDTAPNGGTATDPTPDTVPNSGTTDSAVTIIPGSGSGQSSDTDTQTPKPEFSAGKEENPASNSQMEENSSQGTSDSANTAGQQKAPKTGDTAEMIIWAMLIMVSGMSAAYIANKRCGRCR